MAEFSSGFRIYADSSQFQSEMAKVARTADMAGSKIARAFDAGSIVKGFLGGLGIGSALAVFNRLSSVISETLAHAENLARVWENISQNARNAADQVARLGKTEEQLAAMNLQRLEQLKKKRDELLDAPRQKEFGWGGLIQRGSALDVLFGYSRDADEKRVKEIEALNKKIADSVVETKRNEIAKTKKLEDEAAKAKLEAEKKRVAEIVAAEKAKQELVEQEAKAAEQKLKDEEKALELAREQVEQAKEQLRIKEEIAALNKRDFEMLLSGLVLGGIRGEDLSRASDEQLGEIRRRSEQKLFSAQLESQAGGPGFTFGFSGAELAITRLQNEIGRINAELDNRNRLRRDVQMFGVEGARRNFAGDPLAFDRLVQQLVQDSRDQKTIIAQSNEFLRQIVENQRNPKTVTPVVVVGG